MLRAKFSRELAEAPSQRNLPRDLSTPVEMTAPGSDFKKSPPQVLYVGIGGFGGSGFGGSSFAPGFYARLKLFHALLALRTIG
jgi:hypothetical protein